jgi:hypothetical protein
MLGDPADDLAGGPVLSLVQDGRDPRMRGSRQGPGLRTVDGDLNEPQRVRVLANPTLLATCVNVDPRDPLLVGLTVHRPRALDPVRGRGQPLGDAGALAEVVVVGPRSIALDVGASSLRYAAVELHPAMHADQRLNDVRRQPTDPSKRCVGRPITGDPSTNLRSMRAA